MGLICVIIDKDIEKKKKMNEDELRLRFTGIVIREDGKIAIFNKSNKNEYKLLVNSKVVISSKGVEWMYKNVFKQKYMELLI